MNNRTATAYIGLGSNLGDSIAIIDQAVKMLGEGNGITVSALSKKIRTKPLGEKSQRDYLNAVVKIETSLAPKELLSRMQAIEDSLGRIRTGNWSPRTIDLDLLIYGDEIINEADLIVPHSQMHLRTFVLDGMCEIDKDLIHPVLKRSMSQLAIRLNGNDFMFDTEIPQLISVAGVIGSGKTTVALALSTNLKCEMIREAYDTNPYIEDVYTGRSMDRAIDMELYFLDSRVAQLDRAILPKAVPAVADYIFDKQIMYANLWLKTDQLSGFENRYNQSRSNVASPVLVVYLTGSMRTCLERIHRRNRSFEQQIEIETLEKLSDGYEKLLSNWDQCPVIRISFDEFDGTDENKFNALSDEVKQYICRS